MRGTLLAVGVVCSLGLGGAAPAHAAKPKRVLATGDSMIQIVDVFLEKRLERERVRFRSDARISTGISKPFMLNWTGLARRQAAGLRPNATVVGLGANDGFAFKAGPRTIACCRPAWVEEYALRAGKMMDSYARKGSGHVYWLTLPAPRSASFARVYRAVNQAIVRAASRRRETVDVVDLRRTFTPDGRFRSTIRRRGRAVRVRQADGVHLNVNGSRIAAGLVLEAMRRDRLFR